jgi:hypothetical protein
MKTFATLISAALVAGPALAQDPAALLLSTKQTETTRSGSAGSAVLSSLEPNSVSLLTPNAQCLHSSEKFAPSLGFQTIAGDENADGTVFAPALLGGVDAVLVKPYIWNDEMGQAVPRTDPIDWFDVYVSPTVDVGTFVSGAPGLRRGDCGLFRRTGAGNGRVEHFITAEQIIAALGIVDPQTNQPLDVDDLNLDGIEVDLQRNIFLTLEDDHTVRLLVGGAPAMFLLRDGDVARIPPGAWTPDARGNVGAVLAQRGQIVLREARVDGMVANAMLANVAGACPTTIGDTDAIAMDPNGGVFQTTWDNQLLNLPDLLLAGETLTGAGVISTAAGGTIATVNGCQLAEPWAAAGAPSTGERMGLAPTGAVGSLDGLTTLHCEPCRFVLDSPTPAGLGGPIQVHIGTNLPVPAAVLFWGIGALPVGVSMDFTPFAPGTLCFPEIYPAVLASPGAARWFVPDGFGDRVAWFGPVVAPIIGTGIVFQAAAFSGGWIQLSSPITLN